MLRTMLFAKIHRAAVTATNLHYVGSITIDAALLEASGIRPYEKVQIVDVNNGNRFETYVLAGEAGSGAIELNGASARRRDRRSLDYHGLCAGRRADPGRLAARCTHYG